MNQHKKIWLLLLMLTFMFSFYSVTALATEITPEQVEQILQQQSSHASSQQTGSSSSSKSTVSSKKSTSSRKSSSSVLSSDVSSELSSDLFSSEEVSSEIILPSVNSVEENNPLSSVIVDSAANKKMNWIGILSWICISLGIVVVLIVVFSNRRPPRGGPGRKRYRRPSRTHKKRLLNDKYYRNIKY